MRSLGARNGEIANSPKNLERKRLWRKTKGLNAERPMVLIETCNVWDDFIPESSLQCSTPLGRSLERGLRDAINKFDAVDDDCVIEPRVTYNAVVHSSDYGVEVLYRQGDNGSGHGSKVWDAPLKNLAEDLSKLQHRKHELDVEATNRTREVLEDTFKGILPVVQRNSFWWSLGMTAIAIQLIGLEGFLLAVYDQPDELHHLMKFLMDDCLMTIDWLEENGLLTLNNEDDYIGSGSIGYTDDLPCDGYAKYAPAQAGDLWVLSESQETVSMSPGMFAEFVFPYQLPVVSRFGLTYYGCCEPLEERWDILRHIPNLRCVSVSPWADQERLAEYLGSDYVFCRKPNPALISSEWNEQSIRDDLNQTLRMTKGLNVELVMKDVHNVSGEPWRLGRWVQIAREVIDECCR
ncbi:MAG: hypothetical protein M1305_07755 [Candidatus Marsarchaeota archaeon]|nr:hypothetical protein [Candidatus Marsarchaeota archaeon]